MHADAPRPSDWLQRWVHLFPVGGTVLDLACGSGRHLRWLAERGFRVTGIDVDDAATAPLRASGEVILADLENGPWPITGRRFDAVLVTNYLWRPLFPAIVEAVSPGGVLLYETFAAGNEAFGRPRRPEFLLQPGELLRTAGPLQVVAYEHGRLEGPPRIVQRLAAVRDDPVSGARHLAAV